MLPAVTPRTPATKPAKTLPKTGTLCPQWVRCGKPSCHCASGDLHGPYHYLLWRQGGRLHKRYMKAADVPAVQDRLRQQRESQRRQRRTRSRSASQAARTTSTSAARM